MIAASDNLQTLGQIMAELQSDGSFHVGDGRKLCAAHRRELMDGSGLTAATIRAAGIYTETDHNRNAEHVGWKAWPSARGAALVIPLPGGGVFQLKPMNPRISKGKSVKYETPKGATNRAYIADSVRAVLDDPSVPLLFTEGAKKALAAVQNGFPCIAASGVENWHPKKSSALIPDLKRIKLAVRRPSALYNLHSHPPATRFQTGRRNRRG